MLICVAAALGFGVLVVAIKTRGYVSGPKYDWLAGNSAPALCPMRIASGDLHYQGGGSLYIPPGPLKPGWGESASLHVVGEDLKLLPNRLHITFYSALEDKLYEGNFVLPFDKIAQLFAVGYVKPLGASRPAGKREHATYEVITAGVAPGGAVAVWLRGQARSTEVLFGYASEIDRDWHRTLDIGPHYARADYRADELKELLKAEGPRAQAVIDHVPFGLWERYRKHYAWRPVFENMQVPTEIYPIEYFNGELDFIDMPVSEKDAQALRPVPTSFGYARRLPKLKVRQFYQVRFDEAEIFSTFERIGGNGEPFEFVFRRGSPGESDSVSVRRDTTVIKLQNVKFE